MQRRHFLQTLGAAPPAALTTQAVLASAAPIGSEGREPDEPKVLLYDDGRHAAPIYQYASPLKPSDFLETVDQLVSSGFDTLVYFAGIEGGIALYDSKVSQMWGDNVDIWKHPVWYRGARHLRQLVDSGHDPLKLICDRCHEKGLWCIAANYIGLQGNDREKGKGYGRQSDFVYDHPEFRVGEDADPRAKLLDPKRLNFLHTGLRKERMDVYREMLQRYPTDGVEVNLAEFIPFCKFHQTGQLAGVLTTWLRELHIEAEQAEQTQGRRKRIYVRIPEHPEAWKLLGYEVPVWVDQQIVDGLICLPGAMESPMQQDFHLAAAKKLTRDNPCRLIAGMNQSVGRQFHNKASQEMIWAGAANAYQQGSDGFAVVTYCWFPKGWPWTAEEYQTARLLAHPDMLTYTDKQYHVRSKPSNPEIPHDWLPGNTDPLPHTLNVGQPVTLDFSIADNLSAAQTEEKIDAVHLRLRFTNIEPSLNQVQVQLNGKLLPDDLLRLHDRIYRLHQNGTSNPYGYFYDYHLSADYFPVQGQNRVEITLVEKDPMIDVTIDLYDIDCIIRYRQHRDYDRDVTAD